MKQALIYIFLFINCSLIHGQNIEIPKDVQIKKDNRISKRSDDGKMVVYTVMIFFGNDKNEAYNLKSKFDSKYQNSTIDYESEIKWEEPYFKIYVGKFLSAIEAQKLISELKEWLPNVILVKKKMDFPKV